MRHISFLASFPFGEDLPHEVDLGPAPSPLNLKIGHGPPPPLGFFQILVWTLTTIEPASLGGSRFTRQPDRGDVDANLLPSAHEHTFLKSPRRILTRGGMSLW